MPIARPLLYYGQPKINKMSINGRSPVLFVYILYVDDIANFLSSSKLGCYVGGMYLGCIMHADDIILLSASLNMLQRMLKICETEAHYLDMKFHVAKSMILRVGYSYAVDCAELAIDGCELQFVCKLKIISGCSPVVWQET